MLPGRSLGFAVKHVDRDVWPEFPEDIGQRVSPYRERVFFPSDSAFWSSTNENAESTRGEETDNC